MAQDLALDDYFTSLLADDLRPAGEGTRAVAGGSAPGNGDPRVRRPSSEGARCDPAPAPRCAQADARRPADRPAVGGDADSFDAVLFRLEGLQLAIPAKTMAQILVFPSEIVTSSTAPSWYRGSFEHEGAEVKLVDAAPIVIPAHHRVRLQGVHRRERRRVILLAGGQWALCCEDDIDRVRLHADKIRWRTAQTKRPWLAGTVMEHMCGLLDVGALSGLLYREWRKIGMICASDRRENRS